MVRRSFFKPIWLWIAEKYLLKKKANGILKHNACLRHKNEMNIATTTQIPSLNEQRTMSIKMLNNINLQQLSFICMPQPPIRSQSIWNKIVFSSFNQLLLCRIALLLQILTFIGFKVKNKQKAISASATTANRSKRIKII